MGIVLMFACIIGCLFILVEKQVDVASIVMTIIFGITGVTILMID
jgi:hypothetical protein